MPHVNLHVKIHTVLKQAGLVGASVTVLQGSPSTSTKAWVGIDGYLIALGMGGRGSCLRDGEYRHLSLFVSGEKPLTREAICAGGCHVQLAHQVTEIWPLF